MSFIQANQCLTEEELLTAMVGFDANAMSDDEKIAAKFAASDAVPANISEKNTALGIDISVNLTKAAPTMEDNSQAVAIASSFNLFSGFMGDSEKTADNGIGWQSSWTRIRTSWRPNPPKSSSWNRKPSSKSMSFGLSSKPRDEVVCLQGSGGSGVAGQALYQKLNQSLVSWFFNRCK